MKDLLKKEIRTAKTKLARREARAERIKFKMAQEYVKKTNKAKKRFIELRAKRIKTLNEAHGFRQFLIKHKVNFGGVI